MAELVSDYCRQTFHYVSIVELKDCKMWRDTRYYAEPFEAPEWRARWLERLAPYTPSSGTSKKAPCPASSRASHLGTRIGGFAPAHAAIRTYGTSQGTTTPHESRSPRNCVHPGDALRLLPCPSQKSHARQFRSH